MTDSVLRATHGSPDHPLRIGDIEIPCYVLEGEKRVLVMREMITALDMKQGTATRGSGDRLSKFIATRSLQDYVSPTLATAITQPIRFRTPKGNLAFGYEATILADLCDVVLAARKDKKLNYQQVHIAERCEILVRGFARVGIVALVDEATGYQSVRPEDALAQILERFISKELARWARMFPHEFYQEMFRLRRWTYTPGSLKRPVLVGRLTNDLIYERLAPGVLEELKRITPKNEKGQRKHKYHQRLTEDVGHPRLREHLAAVIALMKASTSWMQFYRMMQRSLPKFGANLELPWPDEEA